MVIRDLVEAMGEGETIVVKSGTVLDRFTLDPEKRQTVIAKYEDRIVNAIYGARENGYLYLIAKI